MGIDKEIEEFSSREKARGEFGKNLKGFGRNPSLQILCIFIDFLDFLEFLDSH